MSSYPAVNAQAMGVLDNSVTYTSGTLAARPAAAIAGRLYGATDTGQTYWDTGSAWIVTPVTSSKGATNIATSQSTSSVTYTTLASPDQITGVVLPTNGLIKVWYQAAWQESVSGAARAAIFVGANQLKVAGISSNGGPFTQAAMTSAGTSGLQFPLASCAVGLVSGHNSNGYTGDVTTGQVVGVVGSGTGVLGMEINGQDAALTAPAALGGACNIFAAAGTYTVSVKFKASSGSVTAANRQLWVQALPYA